MALFLRRGAGAAAAESMITPPWPDASCTAACIRAKSPARAARCGTPKTTLSNLSPSVILPIRPTICPTSTHCSRCGPTRRIARSGPRLPGLAAHFSIKRATRSRVSAPSIPSTTVRPTTARTVTSATTCITAMPTAPSPTWRWTTPGSGPTRGRPKTPSGCKIFLRDAVRPHKRHLGDRWHTAARGGPAPRGHHGHQRPGEPGGGRPQRRGLRAPFLEHAPAEWPTPLLRQLPVLLCPAGPQRPIPHLAAVRRSDIVKRSNL